MYLGIVLLKDRTLRQLFGNFSPHSLGQCPQATDSPTLPDAVYPRACTPRFRESPENLYFNKFPGDADVAGSAHTLRRPQRNVSGTPTTHLVFGVSPRQLPYLPFCTGSHLWTSTTAHETIKRMLATPSPGVVPTSRKPMTLFSKYCKTTA